ncbi:hypothetical protein [Francisella salimarina]|uniref:Outer membrane protein n=1 Tax=Francisella salimarina TaxID=2599927 RepID=A0AAJ4NNS6_9GAMM|nr:hypothetical protein [Francisella salimarina]QWU98956.1 hypothetical protein KQR59_07575 [Francisella salimarina]
MKKILATIFGLMVVSGVYAESYQMYAKPDEKSKKIMTVDDQNPQFRAIFSKGKWIEIVDQKDGAVGWVKQKPQNSAQVSNNKPIEKMMADFQKQQQMIDENFNKTIANIDQNIAQIQAESKTSKVTKKPDVYKEFSSITINSDGKTAKIVKKTEDSTGKVETVEKEVPTDQLNTIKI